MLYYTLTIMFFLLFTPVISANDEPVGYSAKAIIPDNQIDKHQTYFDLLMEPNQKQDIQVEIFNSSNEDIEVSVHITNPTTTRNGLIDYTTIDAEIDETLQTPITDIAAVDDQPVIVPAENSVLVPIHIHMPNELFDGIILGGIYFEKRDNNEDVDGDAVQLTNQYTYVLGLKLSETDTKIEPELALENVHTGLVNYQPAVITTIRNKNPVIIDNMQLNAIVTDSKGNKINQVSVEDYRMAPNSVIPFAIDWKDDQLKPGTYHVDLHAKIGSKTWNWKDEFEVKPEVAEKINKDVVESDSGSNIIWYIVIGFSTIIIILLCIIVWLLKKNKPK